MQLFGNKAFLILTSLFSEQMLTKKMKGYINANLKWSILMIMVQLSVLGILILILYAFESNSWWKFCSCIVQFWIKSVFSVAYFSPVKISFSFSSGNILSEHPTNEWLDKLWYISWNNNKDKNKLYMKQLGWISKELRYMRKPTPKDDQL